MKKFSLAIVATISLCVFGLTGCGGGGESQVIEAPAAEEGDAAMEGVSDADYDAAMEQSMNAQGGE